MPHFNVSTGKIIIRTAASDAAQAIRQVAAFEGCPESCCSIADPEPCPQEFFDAYVTTALWSTNDESDPETGGEPLDANYSDSDISPATLVAMRADCDAFYAANKADLNCDGVTFGPDFGQDGRAGHDFWLNRNGHGAGFWDGDWPEPQASRLDAAARAFSEVDLYVGDDGQIYA